MTCGLLHPAIVLPEDAPDWESGELNRAMLHELEHVRRGDWVSQCMARAVCAVYWFHPLVWIAWRRFTLEAERSCDDAVLRRSEATAYADQLVGLAQRLSLAMKAEAAKPALLAMANRADLAARVGAVLDSRQRRGRAGKRSIALACAAAALLLLTISPLRMVAAPQAAGAGATVASLPQFSSDTMLVITDVTVSDSNGKPIEGLHPGDFLITEDGRLQAIEVFEFQNLAAVPGALPSYYILGYYTNNLNADGKYRNVKITYKQDPEASLKYRNGYYGPMPNGAVAGGAQVGNGVRPPIPRFRQEAQYSEEARRAKWGGTVTLHVDIDASGQVTSVTVDRSLGLGLDEKAVAAVRRWRFIPGTRDGKPVPVEAQVQMHFRVF